jgi:predicted ATPase
MLRSNDHLQPARQHTLRATLDWSCSLLDDTQRTVLRRIAVVAGWFDLATAQQVAADDRAIDAWAVLDALAALVDHSLVQISLPAPDAASAASPGTAAARPEHRAPRYRLAETTRLYGIEQLVAAHEEATTRARWYLALAPQAGPPPSS